MIRFVAIQSQNIGLGLRAISKVKIALLLIAALAGMLVSSVVFAQGNSVSLKVPAASGSLSSIIDAPFEITSTASLGAIQFDILFDSQNLDAVQIEAGEMLTAAQGGLEFNQIEPGRIRVAMACSKPVKGTGPLFRMLATPKSVGDVAVGIVDAQAWESQTLRELRVETTSGSFTIIKPGFDVSAVPIWAWLSGGVVFLIVVVALVFRRR